MNTLRVFAFLFGLAFLAIGVMGFMPAFIIDGNLLGYFEVNDIHNYVHIASGIVALLASVSYFYSRLYFQVFGVVYGLVTIAGFLLNGDLVLMHVNFADNILHLVISVVALYLGFIYRRV